MRKPRNRPASPQRVASFLHKRRTRQAFSIPVSIQKKISVIEERAGLTSKLEASDRNFRLEFFQGYEKVGFFRTSTVSVWELENGPEACRDSLRKLGNPPLWVIRAAEWFDKGLLGKGLGVLAYEILLDYVKSKGGVVGPDSCSGGSTSGMAQRVWDSLKRRYESEGPIVIPKTLRLASPQRVASFYYHQYSSEDYKSEGAEDKGLPSAYSPTNRYPKFDEDHPATKMNDIRSIDGGPGNVPSIKKVRDRFASKISSLLLDQQDALMRASPIKPNQPFIAYHGTSADFDDSGGLMESATGGRFSDINVPHDGIWLTLSPREAKGYAKSRPGRGTPRVIKVEVRLRNPYFTDPQDYADEGISGATPELYHVKRAGFDGVVVLRSKYSEDWYLSGKMLDMPTWVGVINPKAVRVLGSKPV